MAFFGRRKIFTDQPVITRENVVTALNAALDTHALNRQEIDVLYKYYKGDQPIRNRVKEVRPEINNIVVENHAQEIVDFKVGYLMGEPVQYISRVDGDGNADKILKLNAYAISEDMESKNRSLTEWSHICGVGVKMVLPDRERDEEDEAPFEVYVLDPRDAFVVYLNDISERPVMGIKSVKKQNGDIIYSVYTEDSYYEVLQTSGDEPQTTVSEKPNDLGIPMVEYPLNNVRMGSFEVVISLLNALNTSQSNRLDGVEQFVQALMLFHNVKIDPDEYDQLREKGAIMYKDVDPQMKAEIKYLVEELNQTQTQTLVNDIYEKILVICGMPNRNGGSSTSDTGTAVVMRDGWSAAETRAKSTEMMFKQSEKMFLRKVLKICDTLRSLQLKLSAIEVHFTRRNYENIAQKATVLTTMLGSDKIAPQLAFAHSGMFADPELAYKMSKEYAEEQEKKRMEEEKQRMQQNPPEAPGQPAGGPAEKRPPAKPEEKKP